MDDRAAEGGQQYVRGAHLVDRAREDVTVDDDEVSLLSRSSTSSRVPTALKRSPSTANASAIEKCGSAVTRLR